MTPSRDARPRSSAGSSEFIYDQTGNIIAEYTHDGGILTRTDVTTFNPDELVCTYIGDGGHMSTLEILADVNGSTLGLVGDGGQFFASYAYEPYGATTYVGDAGTDQQYTGREYDVAGLIFYRQRHLMAMTGRFISEDRARSS